MRRERGRIGERETALLTTGQAARRSGVSRHTLLRAVRRGKLTPVPRAPDGAYRFRPDDVAAYAARKARGAAPGPVPAEREASENDVGRRGLERLLAATDIPHIGIDALITRVLATVAENLDVAVTYLSRVDGPTLHIERVHDRGGLGL